MIGAAMQRERVEDQYPWTWEIPMAVVCAIIALGIVVCPFAVMVLISSSAIAMILSMRQSKGKE